MDGVEEQPGHLAPHLLYGLTTLLSGGWSPMAIGSSS